MPRCDGYGATPSDKKGYRQGPHSYDTNNDTNGLLSSWPVSLHLPLYDLLAKGLPTAAAFFTRPSPGPLRDPPGVRVQRVPLPQRPSPSATGCSERLFPFLPRLNLQFCGSLGDVGPRLSMPKTSVSASSRCSRNLLRMWANY